MDPKLLDSSHFATAIHVEPGVGVVCIGWHEQTERVRAVDIARGRVLWEAPSQVVLDPMTRAISVAGGRAYVAKDNTLAALDLYTGVLGWQVRLANEIQTGFGRPCLADPYPRGAPGLLVVQLTDDSYVALDRMTGTWRWSLPDAAYFGPFAIPGGVVLCARTDGALRTLFIDPARGPGNLCALPCPFGAMRVAGRNVALGSTDIDGAGHAGVAMVEMPTGRVLLQCEAPFEDTRGAPVVAGPYVWSADLIEFAASPHGPRGRAAMFPGHCIDRLDASGDTLIGLFDTDTGQSKLRLGGFDPRTLAPRWASSVELGARPRIDEAMSNVTTFGPWVAVAGAATGEPAVTLSVLRADGGTPAWQRTAPGTLENLDAVAGLFRLRTDRQTLLYRVEDGAPVARYPLEP